MHAVLHSAGVAAYLFDLPPTLTADGLFFSGRLIAHDVTASTHTVTEAPAPDFWVAGALAYTGGVWTVVDQSRFDEAVGERRAALVAENNTAQARLLTATDWLFIRQADTGTPVPAEKQSERDAIRAAHDAREVWINAATPAELTSLDGLPAWP